MRIAFELVRQWTWMRYEWAAHSLIVFKCHSHRNKQREFRKCACENWIDIYTDEIISKQTAAKKTACLISNLKRLFATIKYHSNN